MIRSPLGYPLNRGMDSDAGGAADLQTDVMRFMAILSLCLVAIFALVQAVPQSPPTPQSPDPRPEPEPIQPVAQSKPEPFVEKPRPEPVAQSKPESTIEDVQPEPPPRPEPRLARLPPAPVYEPIAAPPPIEPIPLASPAAPVPEPAPAPATREPAEEGFTLRFESDVALRRLVARNEIGLYAIRPDKAFRMNVNRGSMSFWPASLPGQFHEMDATTVPTEVVAALRRTGGSGSTKWGVTLPSRLSRDLTGYLNEHTGGALVIDGDGAIRLEQ